MPLFTRLVGIVATIAFAIALATHLLTFTSIDVESAWPRFGLLIVPGIPVVIGLTAFAHYRDFGSQTPADLLRPWAAALLVATTVFSDVDFVLLWMNGSQPLVRDGTFVLVNRGSVRPVSEAEWHAARNHGVRGATLIPLAVYLAGTLLCLGRRRPPAITTLDDPSKHQ
jgi:hypothetical protein